MGAGSVCEVSRYRSGEGQNLNLNPTLATTEPATSNHVQPLVEVHVWGIDVLWSPLAMQLYDNDNANLWQSLNCVCICSYYISHNVLESFVQVPFSLVALLQMCPKTSCIKEMKHIKPKSI